MNHLRLYTLAKIAECSNHPKHKIAAAIVDPEGTPQAIGVSSDTKTHPIQAWFAALVGHRGQRFLHAEIAALVKNPSKASTMYVVRVNKFGQFRYARPCPICQEAIKQSGYIHTVFYSHNDGSFDKLIF